jgi:serine/threonine protein kinase
MPTGSLAEKPLLKLLNCARGHFWESAVEPTPEAPLACPECGAPADALPLIDLAPSDVTAELPPVVPPVEPPLMDDSGRPNVAGFEIREDLGRSVTRVRHYRARQLGINRDVLLEVVVAREDTSQSAWNSLRGEASALGKLAHANVVSVFDVGERDRQLFYNAVELIDGPTLAQKVAEKPLPFPQVARLVELLARALDHAHKKGVLHRNLRPSSVLLQPVEPAKDGRSDPGGAVCQLHGGFYVPKLVGFGIVRKAVEGEAIDADLFGEDAGYLSPEQVWGRARDLGPNTDVYGLGGVLYFLLTGRAPFRGPSYPEILDAIQTAPLTAPSAVRRVPADLEAVCLKALTRTPRRRYGSAAEMAEDLRRFQLGQSIQARNLTGLQRLGRFLGRHPASSVLSVLLLASMIGGAVAYFAGQEEADRARQQEKSANARYANLNNELMRSQRQAGRAAKVQEFLVYKAGLDRAADALRDGNKNVAMNVLNNLGEAHKDKVGFEWHYLKRRSNPFQNDVELTDFAANEGVAAMAFGPQNGRLLATVQTVRAGGFGLPRGKVRLWDVKGKQKFAWGELPGPVHAVAISPDATRIAVAGDDNAGSGTLRVFKIGPGDQGEFDWGTDRAGGPLTGVGYTASGERLVIVSGNGSGSILTPARHDQGAVQFGQFERFGGQLMTRLAVGAENAVTFTERLDFARTYSTSGLGASPAGNSRTLNAQGPVQAVAITEPAGAERILRVALSDVSGTITIHEPGTFGIATDQVKLAELPRLATRLAFSSDGTRLAAALSDGSVRVWALAGGVWVEVLSGLTPALSSAPVGLAFSSDGKALAVGGGRKVVVYGTVE